MPEDRGPIGGEVDKPTARLEGPIQFGQRAADALEVLRDLYGRDGIKQGARSVK
jgi:hypothetical protein